MCSQEKEKKRKREKEKKRKREKEKSTFLRTDIEQNAWAVISIFEEREQVISTLRSALMKTCLDDHHICKSM